MSKIRTQRTQVNFGDVELDVTYIHHRGYPGNRENPPEEESVEVETVKYQGVDITKVINEINESFYLKIENKILEGLNNE